MQVEDIFELGCKFSTDGRIEVAIELWKECVRRKPEFSLSYLNLSQAAKARGDGNSYRDFLVKFLNSPITGQTINIVSEVRKDIEEFDKKVAEANKPKEQPK